MIAETDSFDDPDLAALASTVDALDHLNRELTRLFATRTGLRRRLAHQPADSADRAVLVATLADVEQTLGETLGYLEETRRRQRVLMLTLGLPAVFDARRRPAPEPGGPGR